VGRELLFSTIWCWFVWSLALHGILNQMNKLQLQIGNFLHFLPFDNSLCSSSSHKWGVASSRQSVSHSVGWLVRWSISCCQL